MIDTELDKVTDNETSQPSLKKLKQIDTELFKIRKKIGSLIADFDHDDFV